MVRYLESTSGRSIRVDDLQIRLSRHLGPAIRLRGVQVRGWLVGRGARSVAMEHLRLMRWILNGCAWA